MWAISGETLLYVEGQWSEDERAGLIICEKELLASTWGLVALTPWTSCSFVVSFTDNTVALAAMRSMGSSSKRMQWLVERRTAWLHARGVIEDAARITSKANVWADLGSRDRLGEVLTNCEFARGSGVPRRTRRRPPRAAGTRPSAA